MKQKTLFFALLVFGFSGAIGQVLALRELWVNFSGNEFSFGIIFFNWLILVALGSFSLRKLIDRYTFFLKPLKFFILSQIALALILPLQVFLINISKNLLGLQPGEMVGVLPVFYLSFLILAPLCFLIGFQFVLGCKIYALKFAGVSSKNFPSSAPIGKVYILEALGVIIGGVIFTFLFVHWFSSFEIAGIVALLNLISAFVLSLSLWQYNRTWAIVLLIFFNLAALAFPKIDEVEFFARQKQWPEHTLLSHQSSIYSDLVITEQQGQTNFFVNGLLSAISPQPDVVLLEEFSHFPLLQHPSPQKVLLIGNGIGGILEEIVKHSSVEQIYYLELDPLIIETSQKYLSLPILTDPRVQIVEKDGRLFVKTTKEKFDLVLINLPPPSSLQLNRYYTKDFFLEIEKILKKPGIIALKLPWQKVAMPGQMLNQAQSIYRAAKTVFPEILVIPGDNRILILSSNKPALFSKEPRFLSQEFENRQIPSQLLSKEYFEYKFCREKMEEGLRILSETPGNNSRAFLNRDFRPIAVFHNLALWNITFYPFLDMLFQGVLNLQFWWLLVFLILLGGAFFWKIAKKKNKKSAVCLVVATSGFFGLTNDLMIIFSFQIFHGFVYQKLGILMAVFMAGMALGAWLMTKKQVVRFILYWLKLTCLSVFIS